MLFQCIFLISYFDSAKVEKKDVVVTYNFSEKIFTIILAKWVGVLLSPNSGDRQCSLLDLNPIY